MGKEEAAYWLGMSMHRKNPKRVLMALRCLLTDPHKDTRGTPKNQPKTKQKSKQTSLFDDFDPYAVTPEDALEAARREVKQWRMEQLLGTKRQTNLDPITEWFVLAWDAFEAPRFPYDEALRLARVVGVDLDREIVGHLAQKQSSDLILWDSSQRAAKGSLGSLEAIA